MQERALRRPPGQEEGLQGRKGGLALVDGLLQGLDVARGEGRLVLAAADACLGIRELRAQREEVLLHRVEEIDVAVGRGVGARHPQGGVELVHLAVGGHARVVLAHARAVDESRLARVARLRVDLHPARSVPQSPRGDNGRRSAFEGEPGDGRGRARDVDARPGLGGGAMDHRHRDRAQAG